MVDEDVIAFPICHPVAELDWRRGGLRYDHSYWHSRDRIQWRVSDYINYIRTADFRQVSPSESSTKGVIEGSETSLSWDAIFSTRRGTVEAIRGQRTGVRCTSDGHQYTWRNQGKLPVVVKEGDRVDGMQLLAASVRPLTDDALRRRVDRGVVAGDLSPHEDFPRCVAIKGTPGPGGTRGRNSMLLLCCRCDRLSWLNNWW